MGQSYRYADQSLDNRHPRLYEVQIHGNLPAVLQRSCTTIPHSYPPKDR